MANYYFSYTSQASHFKYKTHPRFKKHQPSRGGLSHIRNMCSQSHLFLVLIILSLHSHPGHTHSCKAADRYSFVSGGIQNTLYSCTLSVRQQVGTGSLRFNIHQRNPSPARPSLKRQPCFENITKSSLQKDIVYIEKAKDESKRQVTSGVKKMIKSAKKIKKPRKYQKKTAVGLDWLVLPGSEKM